jgi:hypothetical protein
LSGSHVVPEWFSSATMLETVSIFYIVLLSASLSGGFQVAHNTFI